jgi:hypothetical protein
MKKLLRIVALIVAVAGVAVALGGILMVALGIFGKRQPPPSLNEGPALAFVVGIGTGLAGLLLLLAGLAVRAGRKPLTGGVIAARARMREIGVDGNEPAKTRRAWTSGQGRPPVRKSVRRAAIGLGSRPSWRG